MNGQIKTQQFIRVFGEGKFTSLQRVTYEGTVFTVALVNSQEMSGHEGEVPLWPQHSPIDDVIYWASPEQIKVI